MKSTEFLSWVSNYFKNVEPIPDFDLKFALRCFSDPVDNDVPPSRFRTRLEMIDCVNRSAVLDFGCGFGQWSITASHLNKEIYSFDPDETRVSFLNQAVKLLDIQNLIAQQGTIESISPEKKFDYIFCYGVLPFLDWRKSLHYFYEALEPGGMLYFNSYDFGWMIYNIIKNPNRNEDFTSRTWAIRTIVRTWSRRMKFSPKSDLRSSLYIRKSDIDSFLMTVGFRIIDSADEGNINVHGYDKKPFFPGKYLGMTAVHEYLCVKI